MFNLINIKTGERLDPFGKGVLMNPFNGSLYFRGYNVTSEYRLEPKMASDLSGLSPDAIVLIANKSDQMQKVLENITKHLSILKGGALKAYFVICQETILKNRFHAVITNERFMEAGDHLTRRDYIGKACDQLVDLGIILKKEVGCFVFDYSLILEKSKCQF